MSISYLNKRLTNIAQRGSIITKSQKKGINVGGDFEDLVTKSSIFVDKSLFVQKVMEDPAKTILITMPRRWGKSLNIDMLKRFLSIQVDREGNVTNPEDTLNYKLFAGGKIDLGGIQKTKIILPSKISKKEVDYIGLTHGKYPVISVDFKDCKGSNFGEVKDKLTSKIYDLYTQYGYLEEFLSKNNKTLKAQQKNQLKSYFEGVSSEEEIQDGLRFLSFLLHTYHNKKVWILIDEYDAAANRAYLEFDEKEANQTAELFRSVYEPALKGNEYLEKGVMTGVQYIVKSGMLSGLNHLEKYNITNAEYSKYYGINQEEMDILAKHFDIDNNKADKIKDWYNGYSEKILNTKETYIKKYNIWSVVKYLNAYSSDQYTEFQSYWEKSGSVEPFLKNLFHNKKFKGSLENLVNGHKLKIGQPTVDFDLDHFQILKNIKDIIKVIDLHENGLNLIYSYLFITGYLTLNTKSLELAIPNVEIKKEMGNYLKNYYSEIFNIPTESFTELTTVLNNIFVNDKKVISQTFTKSFAPKLLKLISELKLYGKDNNDVVGLFANEDLIHSLLNNIAIQVVNARFASERRTTKTDGSKGRADMVIEKNGKGIVIEMKYNAKDAQVALEQAKTYKELVSKSEVQVFVGCNITDKQEVFLSGEIIDGVNDPIFFKYPKLTPTMDKRF